MWFYQLAFDAVVSLQCRDLLNKKFKRNSVSFQSCAISCCLCCCMPQQTTFRQVMRKPAFLSVKTKILFSCPVNMQLISDQGLCFCYISSIIPLLLKPELNEPSTCCSQLLRLYSPVCVRPDLKPRKTPFLITQLLQNHIWNIQNWLIWPPSKSPDLRPGQFAITIQYKNIGTLLSNFFFACPLS